MTIFAFISWCHLSFVLEFIHFIMHVYRALLQQLMFATALLCSSISLFLLNSFCPLSSHFGVLRRLLALQFVCSWILESFSAILLHFYLFSLIHFPTSHFIWMVFFFLHFSFALCFNIALILSVRCRVTCLFFYNIQTAGVPFDEWPFEDQPEQQ